MAVVLISRGTMSGGQALARSLAASLGLRRVCREDLVKVVDSHGEHAKKVVESLDHATRAYEQFSQLRRPYLILMRLGLLSFIREDNVVYDGYSGHLLVPRLPCCLRIRITAPMEARVRNAIDRLHLPEGEAMEALLREDADRVRWARFMYGRDIRDPSVHDACFSLERLTLGTICDMVGAALRAEDFQPTPERRAMVGDLYLATLVEAALVSDPRTSPWEIRARVRDGNVLLEGPHLEGADLAVVLAVARSQAGVQAVEYQPGYASSFEFAH